MTISRRGLFGTLLGGIAAGYAAKAPPAFAQQGGSVHAFATHHFEEWGNFVVGEAGPESIMPLSQVARFVTSNEVRILNGLPPITIDYVAGGCTRDGKEESVS